MLILIDINGKFILQVSANQFVVVPGKNIAIWRSRVTQVTPVPLGSLAGCGIISFSGG